MSAQVLEQSFASTGTVLANITSDQMDWQSPCASWTVRDLVNHVVGGTMFFATIAEDGKPPEHVGDQPDFTTEDFTAIFKEGAKRAVAVFAAEGAMEQIMKTPAGDLPGSVYVLIASVDTFTHGWDLAKATGQSTDLDAALSAQLLGIAQAALPDSFRGPDGQAPFGLRVDVPDSACMADQLAGFMGRNT